MHSTIPRMQIDDPRLCLAKRALLCTAIQLHISNSSTLLQALSYPPSPPQQKTKQSVPILGLLLINPVLPIMSDIKLEKDVMKNILILNNQTPRENNMYWITIEEMRDRLIHCGVDKALTTNMIGEALKKVNRGESFLTRHHEGKTPYYRQSIGDFV